MNIPSNFRPIGPSRHHEMAPEQRAFQYRLTLAALSLADNKVLNPGQRIDLRAAISEAQLITRSTAHEPHELAHLLRILLSEALLERPKDLTLELQPQGHSYEWNR